MLAQIMNTLYNLRFLDDIAHKDTFIHRLHPLVKLLTTIIFLIAVVSFARYEIIGLLPLIFYPLMIFSLGEIPVAPIFKRILLIEPLIIGIGILNPLFDHQLYYIGGIAISRGWITFLSIFIKSGLTITAGLLLIATTGIDELAAALRMLRIPKLFVLQLLLTYRYISVLMEEVARTLRAYSMRSLNQKGIHKSAWGSLSGQLILRTMERAQRIYQAMRLRGFSGDYHTGLKIKIRASDVGYLGLWGIFFFMVRMYNIPILIGTLINNLFK